MHSIWTWWTRIYTNQTSIIIDIILMNTFLCNHITTYKIPRRRYVTHCQRMVNESIDRSVDQPINQTSTDRSISQPIDWWSCQPILIAEQITVYNRIENTWQTEHKSSKPSIRSSTIPCTIQQVSIQVSLWVKEKRKQQNNTIDITTRLQCIASVQIGKRNIDGNYTSANENYRNENHNGQQSTNQQDIISSTA